MRYYYEDNELLFKIEGKIHEKIVLNYIYNLFNSRKDDELRQEENYDCQRKQKD